MNTEKNLKVAETQQMTVTPMDMLRIAIDKDLPIEKLQQLVELQERWEANEARKAYVAAMNAFKADPPDVFKSKHVKFGNTEYDHAGLDDAVEEIGKALSKHGLSFRWDCEQIDGGVVRVTCIITHVQGHSEKTPLQAGHDQSGGKNNIQALGSTVTYLQRYTLFAATGLAAKEMDDDGGAAGANRITEEQTAALTALLEEVGADTVKFLDYFEIGSVSELPAKAYKQAVAMTEAKRRK